MKALALFSGGLDSSLAIKVVLGQGIEVIALNFRSPFCCCEHSKGCGSSIKKMADSLGVEFKSIYLGQDYLEMIRNPKHGYGKNLNPCIDCRIFKFRQAKEIMEEVGASFIISGEVLGQRPMSQHRAALKTIEKESGLEDLVLRPLSAKLLKPTIAEEKSWVRREDLLKISGRGRKPQISLAFSLGVKDYPCPAGGCLLTDSNFSNRLKDLFKFEQLNLNDAKLLRVGRHFRISPQFKLVVGRNEKENMQLLNLSQNGDLCFECQSLPGPTAIGRGIADEEAKIQSARIVARYTSLDEEVEVLMKSIPANGEKKISVQNINEKEFLKFRI
ncbi:MAG: hypothetical protein NG737_01865 [Omnitrophica bacterium]|nr:hypothetical protein [Candidatus Omnitrophota bacterium]